MKQPLVIFAVLLAAIAIGVYGWHSTVWNGYYEGKLQFFLELRKEAYSRDTGHPITEAGCAKLAAKAADNDIGKWRMWLALGLGLGGGFCFALGLSIKAPDQQQDRLRASRRVPAGGDRRKRNRSRRRGDDPDRSSDEKVCPQCAETIKRKAKVCRFCGHDFVEATKPYAAVR